MFDDFFSGVSIYFFLLRAARNGLVMWNVRNVCERTLGRVIVGSLPRPYFRVDFVRLRQRNMITSPLFHVYGIHKFNTMRAAIRMNSHPAKKEPECECERESASASARPERERERERQP